MKFDLHCHTAAGSIDSKVSLEDFITILKSKGFDGMMVTDHDSYKGCRVWDEIKNDPKYADFTVLKGVEYDTKDAGHILVIMPDGIEFKALTVRGMKLKNLIKLVHGYGGILGPAHPFGVRSSSIMFQRALKKHPEYLDEFDFVEGFNTCESEKSNVKAAEFAAKYELQMTGGSDAHKEEYVGMAYTEIDADIRSNNDFIRAVRQRKLVSCGGTIRKATKNSIRKEKAYAVWGFKVYNKGLGKLFSPVRGYMLWTLTS